MAAKPPLASAAAGAKATFAEGTYVFVPDEDDCYVPAKVNATFIQGAQGSVSVVGSKQQYTTVTPQQSENCVAMDSQSLESIDNMVDLKSLNNASILQNLRLRFNENTIYTSIGTILVSINPFKLLPIYTPEIQDNYIKLTSRRLPPHIYGVADLAYRNMTDFGNNQACIVSGESGAGKTEATKLFLSYIAEISARRAEALKEKAELKAAAKTPAASASSASAPAAGKAETSLQDRLLEANPLMEAFGNAKTSRNDNSSRFGKWIAVSFDPTTGAVVGGGITDYLLEKSRIVKLAEGERNYHIFYQLCAGCSTNPALQEEIKVTDPSSFNYLNQSSAQTIPSINDEREWTHTLHACEVVGISDKVKSIQRALAGILHLGNVVFKGDEKSSVMNKEVLAFAASLMEVDAAALEKGLICKNVSTGRDVVFKDNTASQAADTRDAFAKQLYGMMFSWLIGKINQALGAAAAAVAAATGSVDTGKGTKRVIGVLDIFGFESFVLNSFEQLCINYCNEKLQGHFNQHIFMLEQEEYKAEGVDVSKIEFFDNATVLDVLERKKKGVFQLIDEEITVPRGTDETCLKKVLDIDQDAKDATVLKRPNVKDIRTNAKLANVFIIVHYAGEVGYDITGFLYKNKDELPPDLENLLASSKSDFIRDLFSTSGGVGGSKSKKTLGLKFKEQLAALMTTLNSTEPHFVRCIKPNMEKVGGRFHAPMVLDQLRYSGLLEVCRIRQLGYPIRKDFKEFVFRYFPIVTGTGTARELKALTALLAQKKMLSNNDWQIGNSKVFMRSNNFNLLEIAREEALKKNVAKMQKIGRGFVERRRHKKRKAILKGIEDAIKTNTEDALEDAILSAGNLPYRGAHLKILQKAYDAIETIRQITRAAQLVEDAMKTRQIGAITAAIEAAAKVGAGEHPTVKKAKALVEVIKSEDDCKAKLKEAVTKSDIKALQDALATAAKLHIEGTTEAREADATLKRLQQIEKTVAELSQAVAKKNEAKIKELMNKMAELGARDHPAVAEAEKTTKIIAEMSARHARRIADIKERIGGAKIDRDYQALCNLEVEAQKLGIQNEKDVIEAMKIRDEIKIERGIKNQLDTAIRMVESKADSPNGIKKEDIQLLTDAINAARKAGAAKDSEALERAMEVESRVKKQLQVQADLEDALKSMDEKKLRTACDAAVELGLTLETARKAQAEIFKLEAKKQAVAEAAEAAAQRAAETAQKAAKKAEELKQAAAPSAAGGDAANTPRRTSIRKSITEAVAAAASAAASPVKKLIQPRKAAEIVKEIASVELAIPTEKDLEKGYADRIAKAAAAARNFQSRLFRAVGPHFHYSRYLRIRPDEDFTELIPQRKKKAAAKKKLKFQKEPITKSLMLLKDHLSDDSVKLFDALLGWCGDKPVQFPSSMAQYILKKGLQEPRLVDEIFLQIMKQLTENPDTESEDRGWLLLCIAVQTFPPSKEFEAFLLNFVAQFRTDPGMIGNYSRFCLFNIGATEKIGPTKFMPQTQDIEVYLKRPPVILKVHNIFRIVDQRMTWTEVPVWPVHDVTWVCKLLAESTKVPQKIADFCGLFVKDVEDYWGTTAGENGAPPKPPGADAADGDEAKPKKTFGFASVSIGAAITFLNNASQMVKNIATVGRDPPSAIAPWPLPGSIFPGDVYRRMSQQDRTPVFTYQRKIITEADLATPDKALFIQTMMSVVNGQLPIPNEAEVVELASLALASRGKEFPESPAQLVMSGLFTYIPATWCENKSETFWTNAVSGFIRVAGKDIPKMDEAKVMNRYLQICKRSALFGACIFSIVRKEDESHDYICAVNGGGVHVVPTDTFKILGTIPFSGVEKFGASATYVWFSVAPAVVQATPTLFPPDKYGNENTGIVFLHSSQAAEIYHIVYEWAYYSAHKAAKAPNLF